ncbi:hypothetical protein GCM10009682_48560 [Luedemannella flava]|uniref:Uncharacterized protein n=1 Tax=Luedemannella flava TaxID=349316 RepID=A0ABN2MEQ7_9ACTN
MPVSVSQQDQRGARPLVILFWSGVGVAPLAALLFLVGATRFAGVLALVAMVLIGLSITLRRDTDAVRIELQETLLGELDQLRNDVREDVATASRNTHRSLTDRINALSESVEGLRGHAEGIEAVRIQLQQVRAQVDELRSRPVPQAPAAVPGRPTNAPPNAAGVVRTETVEVTRRTMTVEGEERGTVYGSRASEEPPAGERCGARRRADDDNYDGSWDASDPRWEAGGQWTGARQQDWDEPSQEWSRETGSGGRRRRETGEAREARPRREAAVDREWEGHAHGDRWAEVRSDEHGRELRMGEHRSSVRSDANGTEMRVEDRWAAVRRAEREGGRDAGQAPRDMGQALRALPPSRGESPQAYTTGGSRRPAPEPEWERGGDAEWEQETRGVRERREEREQTEGRTARESKLVRAHRDAEARDDRETTSGRHEGQRRHQGPAPRSHRGTPRDRDRDGDIEHVGAEYTWSPLQDFGAVEDDAEDWNEPSGTYDNWQAPRQRSAPPEEYDRWR